MQTTAGMSEAEQLAWAQKESQRAEEERLKKERQEQADLELAIALSKQENRWISLLVSFPQVPVAQN